MFQQSQKSHQSPNKAKIKGSNVVDRMNRRLKRTHDRNQFLLTQKSSMNESITIEKQGENNVIDELKSKNGKLIEQVDDLKNQLQSLKTSKKTQEYINRHCMQRIDELEKEHKKIDRSK